MRFDDFDFGITVTESLEVDEDATIAAKPQAGSKVKNRTQEEPWRQSRAAAYSRPSDEIYLSQKQP
jgi:hypothetical protein